MSYKRSVLRYYGGKAKLASWIISFFPPHKNYIEVFGGAANVLIRKPRSHTEIYNDLNGDLVNLFRILQDPQRSKELIRLLSVTPFSREEYELAHEYSEDNIERARRLIIRSFQGFNAMSVNTQASTSGFRSCLRDRTTHYATWADYPNRLLTIIERLQGVCIENQDWQKIIPRFDREDTLFYCDPPYLLETRAEWHGPAGTTGYSHDMTSGDHEKLLEILNGLKGMVILSGYPSELYDRHLDGWDKKMRVTRGGTSDKERTEVLWLSPSIKKARLPLFSDIQVEEL